MRYIEMRENREHGTPEFPYAYYIVSETHPRYNMIYHWHAECEVLFVRAGSLSLSLDGQPFHLSEGDCILMTGGRVHGGVPDHCVYECLVFDADSLLNGAGVCSEEFAPVAELSSVSDFIFKPGSLFNETVQKIFTFMKEKPGGYHFFVRGELLNLLGMVVSRNAVEHHALTPLYLKRLRKLKHVIRYISERYQDPITLRELAEQCGMNSNYFCRAFKEFTGMTPVEYLNFYRVESACERILKAEESITEIAFLCGFNDFSYFIKVFKKYKGITPSQYAKKILLQG